MDQARGPLWVLWALGHTCPSGPCSDPWSWGPSLLTTPLPHPHGPEALQSLQPGPSSGVRPRAAEQEVDGQEGSVRVRRGQWRDEQSWACGRVSPTPGEGGCAPRTGGGGGSVHPFTGHANGISLPCRVTPLLFIVSNCFVGTHFKATQTSRASSDFHLRVYSSEYKRMNYNFLQQGVVCYCQGTLSSWLQARWGPPGALDGFLAVWCFKMFQEHLVFSCPGWNRPSLQGVLATVIGSWCLETMIWVLGCPGSLLLGCHSCQPSQWTEPGLVQTQVHTHRHPRTNALTHIYIRVYLMMFPHCRLTSPARRPCVQFIDAQSSSLGPWQGSVGLRKLSLEAVI